MGKLIMAGASEGAAMPNDGIAQRYAELLRKAQRRHPDAALAGAAPKAPATDQQVADFYKANIARYPAPGTPHDPLRPGR
jgi:peptidyl-prolyl cis-trans isomerase D